MNKPLHAFACLLLYPVLMLSACKRRDPPAIGAPAAQTAGATPAAASASAPASVPAAAPFDVASVPVSTATMPPFPFVAFPKDLGDGYHNEDKAFDRVYVVAGQELRPVEGHLSLRFFPPSAIKMSNLAAFRNYDQVIKSLGGVRVDTVAPGDQAFIARNGGDRNAILAKLRLLNLEDTGPDDVPTFAQYLIRTPTSNVWISFSLFDDKNNVNLVVLEEKAMQQTVGLVTSDTMASALKQDGHIALYLNFDTDSAVLRPDSQPTVEQIVKLLDGDKALVLKVQGHTDTTGDAAHNRALSLARAQSVVETLLAQHVPTNRLSAEGKGPDQPTADNGSEAGRAKNRRVELVRS